jgi:hypothetical protein
MQDLSAGARATAPSAPDETSLARPLGARRRGRHIGEVLTDQLPDPDPAGLIDQSEKALAVEIADEKTDPILAAPSLGRLACHPFLADGTHESSLV